ncbi:MAG: hypothetical protein AAB443_02415 [Patescibacteria group bacterium]
MDVVKEALADKEIAENSENPVIRGWAEAHQKNEFGQFSLESATRLIKANSDFLLEWSAANKASKEVQAKEVEITAVKLKEAYDLMVEASPDVTRLRNLETIPIDYEQMDLILEAMQFVYDQSFYLKEFDFKLNDEELVGLHDTVHPIYAGSILVSLSASDIFNKTAQSLGKNLEAKEDALLDFAKITKPKDYTNPVLELQNFLGTLAETKLTDEEKNKIEDELKRKEREQLLGEAELEAHLYKLFSREEVELSAVAAAVTERVQRLGFEDSYLSELSKGIKDIYQRTQAVNSLFRRHEGDTQKMYLEVFGTLPRGKVEVSRGVGCVFFALAKDDYLTAFGTASPYANTLGKGSDGVFLSGFPEQSSLKNTICLERKNDYGSEYSNAVHNHENRHSWQRAFSYSLRSVYTYRMFKEALAEDQIEKPLRSMLLGLRESYEKDIANEIDAYFCEGIYSAQQIFATLTKPIQKKGLYDYRGRDALKNKKDITSKDYFLEGPKSQITTVQKILGPDHTVPLEKAVEEVFITDFKETIKRGIGAYQTLINNGYSIEEASALLSRKSLTSWGEVVEEKLSLEHGVITESNFTLHVSDPVIAEIGGQLVSGLTFVDVDGDTGLAVVKEVSFGEEHIHKVDLTDLKRLNVPEKRLGEWIKLWARSGGEIPKDALEGMDLDYATLQGRIQAHEAWKIFATLTYTQGQPRQIIATLVKEETLHKQRVKT